ncbi:hypothetical protein B7494_g3671 [Chlorociboria aeruginascens]|nr:hypothetical protein B7494_g3671 [Chlorociboria aeruginascens]
MQYLYSALGLLSISTLATAQVQIPTCAQPCIANAASSVTSCTQNDDACLCEPANRSAIQRAATSCVITNCGAEAAIVSAACAAISSAAAALSSTPPLTSATVLSSPITLPESATIVPPLASTSVAVSSTPATTTTQFTSSSTASSSASASATKNAAANMGASLTGALGLFAAVLGIWDEKSKQIICYAARICGLGLRVMVSEDALASLLAPYASSPQSSEAWSLDEPAKLGAVGTSVAGYCPGAADIQCCVASCSTPSGTGICEYNTNNCAGSYVAGYCPGPSDFECCVTGSTGTGSGRPGIDISGTPPSTFWSCAASSYEVVTIEGYGQSCSTGGAVKSNFVANYNSAKAAGFSAIHAYLFPCTGTQPTGVACKSPSTQLAEFMDAVTSNGMDIEHFWFDIEPTSGACNAWNLGTSANEALAQQWVALLQSSGNTWGIYANGNQWTSMFASRSTDIGSSLPLWAVQDDGTPGANTVTTFMGGWTSASAKQYSLSVTECGFSEGVDLDSFL